MTRPVNTWRDYIPPPGSRSTRPSDVIASAPKPAAPSVNKFNAKATAARDGTVLDSSHEAKVYQDLLFRERAGEITELRRQVPIPLDVNGQRITTVKVDFVFRDCKTGQLVYLEAKSPITRTRQYVISRKLFAALIGVQVEEA